MMIMIIFFSDKRLTYRLGNARASGLVPNTIQTKLLTCALVLRVTECIITASKMGDSVGG